MKPTKAFISYVHEDEKIVANISRNLQRNGVGVWIDKEELAGGQRWKVAIREAIKDGAFFVSVHSENRQNREATYANEELLLAIDELRKRPFDKTWLIPVRLDSSDVEDRPLGGGETYLDLHIESLADFDKGMLRLLKSMGIREPVLAESKKKKREKEFTAPCGSVFSAIKALEELSALEGDEAVSRDTLAVAFGDNTITDLSRLGLIYSPSPSLWMLTEVVDDARLSLAVAMSKIPQFQVAASELKKNIDSSGVQIGRSIADYLGRDWKTSSCQRNGAAYKKWIFVLYPNFQLPKPGDPSFLKARCIARKPTKKGRATYFTPDVLLRLGQFKKRGLTIKEMAEELGIRYESFSNWTRREPEIWKNL